MFLLLLLLLFFFLESWSFDFIYHFLDLLTQKPLIIADKSQQHITVVGMTPMNLVKDLVGYELAAFLF